MWYNRINNKQTDSQQMAESRGINMSDNTLVRANRVAVKVNGDGFIADFYRTHKIVGTVDSENTEWEAPADATNKTASRESFRQYVISNATGYGIEWKPEDMRAPQNIRKAKYDSDQALIDDALPMVIAEMQALTEKCKYGIEWGGVNHEDIVPLTHTGSGRDLSTMGIEDGKYSKSGNWAWANVNFTSVFKYNKEECYIPVTMQLVSGQLKKVGMGITEFTSRVKDEIINAGLATAEQLDPPKKSKPKAKKSDTEEQEQPVESVEAEPVKEEPPVVKSKVEEPAQKPADKPKRQRRSRAKKSEE